MKYIILVIVFFVIIGCNKKIMKTNESNNLETNKAENRILNNFSWIKEITAIGSDYVNIDFDKKVFEIENKIEGESIGFYNNSYIYLPSDVWFNNGYLILMEINEKFENISFFGKVSFDECNWKIFKDDYLYISKRNNLKIYKYNNENLLEKYEFVGNNEFLSADLIFKNQLLYLTEEKEMRIKELDQNNFDFIIDIDVSSYCVSEDGRIFYIKNNNNLFIYNISNKKIESINYQIHYNNTDKIVKPIELMLVKDNKLFYVTSHYDWTMPFKIFHYLDLKERKEIDIVKFIGLYSLYKIVFN